MTASRSTTIEPPGRILFLEPELVQTGWTWRKSWYSGSDSIYALLAKFAQLNGLSNRELCELFVERHEPQVRAHLQSQPYFPKVDLRSSRLIRLGRLCALLQLDAEQLRQAFVADQFPNARLGVNPNLVWCQYCVQRGYHAASFQLNHFTYCPLHRVKLHKVCRQCRKPLPYILNAVSATPLFACANCGNDHAGLLRDIRIDLSLGEDARLLFRDHLELVRLLDGLPTVLDSYKRSSGDPTLPLNISKPDAYRRKAAYQQFVADVLHAVATRKCAVPSIGALAPSATYTEPYEPLRVILKDKKAKTRKGDPELDRAWVVYRTIRRWLSRHLLAPHASCIATAMKHFWWNPEGSATTAFCPVALAFIRWRMHWEGCHVPGHLNQHRAKATPYGLLAWISSEAPISSPLWTTGFDQWVNSHLVGLAVIDSFRGWLAVSQRCAHFNHVRWRSIDSMSLSFRHWACSGRGTLDEPGLLFTEELPALSLLIPVEPRRQHRRRHGELLARILH